MKLFGLNNVFPLGATAVLLTLLFSLNVAVGQELPDGYMKVWVPDAIQQQLNGVASNQQFGVQPDLAQLANAKGFVPAYRKRNYYNLRDLLKPQAPVKRSWEFIRFG